MKEIVVIGGGAAGFFAALQAKKKALALGQEVEVSLLEKSGVFLSKVRVSGGGRCNVTHACFDPKELTTYYPRGGKELLGPFHKFQPRDTMDWFEERGVSLKVEEDGRVFPSTDSSETIIQTLIGEAKKLGVFLRLRQRLGAISYQSERPYGKFEIECATEGPLRADALILATGSGQEGHRWAEALGHTLVPPVPSLFTFNVPQFVLEELSGISIEDVSLSIEGLTYKQRGPLLLTHFGFSGPAAIKLSAWAARELFQKEYRVSLFVDWLPGWELEELYQELCRRKKTSPDGFLSTEVSRGGFEGFPKRVWRKLLEIEGLHEKKLGQLSDKILRKLSERLKKDRYLVHGKTTHKEEFVTCGGVALGEVDFRTMESRKIPGLFFSGEILDVDGVTGGFNFQHAWTSGWIAGGQAVS